MAFADWSVIPANNAILPGMNWAEGMAPAAINDNMRELIAQLKKHFAGYNTISPERFGAMGGGADDHAAFREMSEYVNDIDGGVKIRISGDHTVGRQTFAGAVGLEYAYLGQNVIELLNCTKPVLIELTGRMKLKAGLKYGSFDPTTGLPYIPGGFPFTNKDYRADVGFMIFANACSGGVFIYGGGELDGNDVNLVLGGGYGDSGRQIIGSGIGLYETPGAARGIYSHHHAFDGSTISHTGLSEDDDGLPVLLENCRFEYNGRQGCSWVGGRGLTAIRCSFSHTGRSASGIQTSPSAGFDIEAESSVCRDGMFIGCTFSNNLGAGMVADSGDSANMSFLRCRFIGTTYYSIWPKKPGFKFRDCIIAGQATSLYSSLMPGEAPYFDNCLFTFKTSYSPTGALYNSNTYLIDMGGGAEGVVFQSCGFDTGGTGLFPISASINVTYRNCTFQQTNVGVNSMNATFEGTTRLNTGGGSLNMPANAIRGRFIYNGVESNLYPTAPVATDLASVITLANALKVATDGLKITG